MGPIAEVCFVQQPFVHAAKEGEGGVQTPAVFECTRTAC
jgi:hypothetical protein